MIDQAPLGRRRPAESNLHPAEHAQLREVLVLTQARQMRVPAQERLAVGVLSCVVRTDGDPARVMKTVRTLIGR